MVQTVLNRGNYNGENTHVLNDQSQHFGGQQFPAGISDGTVNVVRLQGQGTSTVLFEHDAQYFVGKSIKNHKIDSKNNSADVYEQIRYKNENQDTVEQEIVFSK